MTKPGISTLPFARPLRASYSPIMAGSARADHAQRAAAAHSRQSEKKRAQNMNHLLSFTLPPRPEPSAPPRRNRRGAYKPFSRESE